MWGRKGRPGPLLIVLWPLAALGLVLTGCGSAHMARLWPAASFPPQQVMENGDYQGFLRENQRQLERCGAWTDCALPLYNLAFIYAYPESPYRDSQRARQYVRELQRRYPHSPWASQGQVLIAFMKERASLVETQRRLRSELRTQETANRKLRGQLHRSQEIDLEIEKKERELLR